MNYKKALKRKLPTLAITVLILISLMLSSLIGDGAHMKPDKNKLNIVTTTTMVYDITKQIGGERVSVTALMGAGIDPHLYQASAGDVIKLQQADAVIYNGLHLEGKMGEIFASVSAAGRSVICVGDGIDSKKLVENEENSGIYDPHIWFDVSIWQDGAKHIAAELIKIDAGGEQIYTENLEKYLCELEQLNQYVKDCTEQIPENQRVLITAHDAFGYFGRAYGFEVMGLQGFSTDAQVSAAELSRLAAFIAENKIKAVFIESSISPKNIQALQEAVKSQGFEVEIGGALYSDSLGDAQSGHDSYILTFKSNIQTIMSALK